MTRRRSAWASRLVLVVLVVALSPVYEAAAAVVGGVRTPLGDCQANSRTKTIVCKRMPDACEASEWLAMRRLMQQSPYEHVIVENAAVGVNRLASARHRNRNCTMVAWLADAAPWSLVTCVELRRVRTLERDSLLLVATGQQQHHQQQQQRRRARVNRTAQLTIVLDGGNRSNSQSLLVVKRGALGVHGARRLLLLQRIDVEIRNYARVQMTSDTLLATLGGLANGNVTIGLVVRDCGELQVTAGSSSSSSSSDADEEADNSVEDEEDVDEETDGRGRTGVFEVRRVARVTLAARALANIQLATLQAFEMRVSGANECRLGAHLFDSLTLGERARLVVLVEDTVRSLRIGSLLFDGLQLSERAILDFHVDNLLMTPLNATTSTITTTTTTKSTPMTTTTTTKMSKTVSKRSNATDYNTSESDEASDDEDYDENGDEQDEADSQSVEENDDNDDDEGDDDEDDEEAANDVDAELEWLCLAEGLVNNAQLEASSTCRFRFSRVHASLFLSSKVVFANTHN